ncbi:MAG TPA: adenylate/guanylate cyclase domain-containing protein, partial [Actinomycetota bacterium]|nr:adenylate/guanylate cyclase domain-containing protein [Actinomycetota bacterium]
MPNLPTGVVTFLFTDIEGSTKLLRVLGDAYRGVISQHHGILREAIALGEGTEVGTEGDAFFAVFVEPGGAIATAVTAQRSLAVAEWPGAQAVRVRMGLHTGRAVLVGDEYMGLDIHLAARIAAAGHGGQVLVSEATKSLVEPALPAGVRMRDLGRHRLKDIEQPVRLWDLVIEGLVSDFPAIRSLEARPNNLPTQRTSFIGRERELAEVTAILEESRLVTLTGPGGTGKTRLALRAAADQLERFADGVFFVDLSAIVDEGLVPAAIAQALIVREEPGRDILDTVADHVRDRAILLVLDNSEQVIESGASVAKLLDGAPRLSVLATSRIPFRISGERAYPVPPLVVPDEGASDVDDLAQSEAVILFTERAAAVRPGFHLTPQNAKAVSGIITRLEGLPLAIELAASRLNVLTAEQLLDRLGRRLGILSGGTRDLPERQRTLRGTIEWSHDLLGPGEQRLFARLGVFSGGWSLDTAEAVCGADLDVNVLDGLSVLVDSSMVRRGPPDDEQRFSMLETIREFAVERLANSEEAQEIRRRHAEHFRDVGEDLAPRFFYRWAGGAELGARAKRLDRENDNVRAALEWSLSDGHSIGLRLAIAMSWYWQHRGHLAEGSEWLERVVAKPHEGAGDALRARALLALGDIGVWQGDQERMVSAYVEARGIAEKLADPALLAVALLDLADVEAMFEGNFRRSHEILTEGLAMAERSGDETLVAEIRSRAATSRVDAGMSDAADARKDILEAIAVHRRAGADWLVALNLNRLASIELMIGDLDASDDYYRQALTLVAAADNVVATAIVLRWYAGVGSKRGQHFRVARLVGISDRIQEEVGGG